MNVNPLTADRILDKLEAVKTTGANQWQARCPAHDDGNPSLSVKQIDGRALLYCHAGCATRDIVQAVGLTMPDLFDSPRELEYRYDNGRVARRSYDSNGKKIFRQSGTENPPELYRLARVRAAMQAGEPIILCEGEEDVRAAESWGITATTAPQGAGNWAKVDYTPLRGVGVLVVVDNDEVGLKRGREIVPHLQNIGVAGVRVLRSPHGNDLADHVAAGGTLAELVPVDAAPTPDTPAANATPEAVRIVGRKASEITPEKLRWLWADRIPLGTLAVFAGRGGEGKSTFALHLTAQLTRGLLEGEREGRPVNVGIASLEDDEAAVTVPRLMGAGADLDRVHLFTADTAGLLVTLPDSADALAAFIREHELRAVILDPATSMLDGNHNNRHEVRRALDPLLLVAEATGCTFILVQHLNKGGGNMSDKLAGSAAFRDTARCVLLFAADLDTGERVATFDKGNYSETLAASLSFKIANHEVKLPGDDVTHVGVVAELGESDRDAQTVMNARYQIESPERTQERSEIETFLFEYLAARGGVDLASNVIRGGKDEGYSESAIKKARSRCKAPKIDTLRQGFGAPVVWKIKQAEALIDDSEAPIDSIGDAFESTSPMESMGEPVSPMQGGNDETAASAAAVSLFGNLPQEEIE